MSVDAETGAPVVAKVLGVSRGIAAEPCTQVTVDAGNRGAEGFAAHGLETFTATDGHPFLVLSGERLDLRGDAEHVPLYEPLGTARGRWVRAAELLPGDTVATRSGSATVVRVAPHARPEVVYNLHVEGTARYLVGACGVVVHNKDPGDVRPNGPTPRVRAVGDALEDWLGPDAKPIVNKHGDLILLSKDGKRKAQFHFKTPHTPDDLPHVHLQIWDDVTKDWIDAIPDRHRIYPGGTSFGG